MPHNKCHNNCNTPITTGHRLYAYRVVVGTSRNEYRRRWGTFSSRKLYRWNDRMYSFLLTFHQCNGSLLGTDYSSDDPPPLIVTVTRHLLLFVVYATCPRTGTFTLYNGTSPEQVVARAIRVPRYAGSGRKGVVVGRKINATRINEINDPRPCGHGKSERDAHAGKCCENDN